MKKSFLISLLGTGLMLSACSGAGLAWPGLSVPTSKSFPQDHLTGFGATRLAWDKFHRADTATAARPQDCCYLPLVSAGGSHRTYTWKLDNEDSPDRALITDVTHNFPPKTSQATVLKTLAAQDLPLDARVVATGRGRSARTWIYQSKIMAAAAPANSLGTSISVTLYTAQAECDDATPYDPNEVQVAEEVLDNDPNIVC